MDQQGALVGKKAPLGVSTGQGRSQDFARGGALGRADRGRLIFWLFCGAHSAPRKILTISVLIS